MKLFKTFLAASIIALISTAAMASSGFGGGKNVEKSTLSKQVKTDLFKQLKSEIHYDAFATMHNVEGKVYLNFKVAEDGTVKVLGANGTNPVLTSHVRNILNGFEVETNPMLAGKEFTTKFDFFIVQ